MNIRRGVEEAAFGGVVVESFDGLGGEYDAGVEAAEPFEQRGGVAEAEGGELVNQQQHFSVGWLSAGAVVGEVFEEVPGEGSSTLAMEFRVIAAAPTAVCQAGPMGVETYRGVVAPVDCDHLGHMNVQHYFRAVSDGMYSLMATLGLDLDAITARQISFAVVHADTDFMAELVAGDVIALRSAVETMGRKSVEFRHELINMASGQTVMSTKFKCVLLDLEKRAALEIPPDIRERMAALASSPAS